MTVKSSNQSWFATETDSNHARTGPENDILLLVTRNASFGFYLLAFFQDKFTPLEHTSLSFEAQWNDFFLLKSVGIFWVMLYGGWASEILHQLKTVVNIPLYPTILLGFQPSGWWCRISLTHPQYPTFNCLWWSMVRKAHHIHINTSSDWWFGTFLIFHSNYMG